MNVLSIYKIAETVGSTLERGNGGRNRDRNVRKIQSLLVHRYVIPWCYLQILPRKAEPPRGGGRAPRARQQCLADPVQREREQGDHLDEEVRGAGNPGGESGLGELTSLRNVPS